MQGEQEEHGCTAEFGVFKKNSKVINVLSTSKENDFFHIHLT